MKSVVSVRGQTVVPKEVREALGIKPGTMLSWSVKNGSVVVQPLPDDPIGALKGILRDSGYTFEQFLAERQAERAAERPAEDDLN